MINDGFLSSGICSMSLLFLLLPAIQPLFGQNIIQPDLLKISQNSVLPLQNPVSGTLNIIAVMVEFEPDNNPFTSGDGTFNENSLPYLQDPGTNIDPLPHNSSYFEAHLEFVKNYFERISGNLLSIEYQVLPDVYQLPNPMETYSPVGEDPELNPLAELTRDVWMEVSQSGSLPITLDPGNDTAFIIFHAGVGRDIELTGTTLDKTPQDIPSVYLNRQAISNLLNDPGFAGFPIDNGNILADNTLIVPRTLTRSGEDISGNRFVLPLSVNGMITAQIGSHLGLPDLFNTETGESGIGRFGLMDGAGIFAYNGLFPPELSAWEKIYLGWKDSVTVSYDTGSPIALPAASLNAENSIAKVPISEDEYFLLENRHRDADGNGITLTIQTPSGSLEEVTFTNEDVDFVTQQSGFDSLLPSGVVTNVSNFDFALPGGLDAGEDNTEDTEDDRNLNGGILIWHIDQSLIRQKIDNNEINSDPNLRGVNLQEADGARDIGRPVSIGISQNEINGSPFDFWWAGNDSRVITQSRTISLYENRFAPDTTPDNSSNSGAVSYFEIYNFSDNLPEASFQIRPVQPFDEIFKLTDSRTGLSVSTYTGFNDDYWKRYPLALVPYQFENQNLVLIPGNDGIQFYDIDSKLLSSSTIVTQSLQQPFINQTDGIFSIAGNPLISTSPFTINLNIYTGGNPEEIWSFEADPNSGFISSSVPSNLDLDGTSFRADYSNEDVIIDDSGPSTRSEKIGDYQSVINQNGLTLHFPGSESTFSLPPRNQFERRHTGIIEKENGDFIFYLLTDGKLSVFLPDNDYSTEQIIEDSELIDWPAIVDFNSDGSPDFLYVDPSNNQLIAKNIRGAMLNNFPINAPDGVRFIGTPLIVNISSEEDPDILLSGQSLSALNIYGYNNQLDKLQGFPLLAGGITEMDNQPIHPVIVDNQLIAVSHTGDLKVWTFNNLTESSWPARYGTRTNNKVSGILESDSLSEPQFTLLNQEETYNWPNPAKDETFLRFQTSTNAEIRIIITSLSGRTIYDREITSSGGVPEEHLIDTSGWASGGYFSLVTATANGKTERKLVKIAIVK
jgi:hypothetical protein